MDTGLCMTALCPAIPEEFLHGQGPPNACGKGSGVNRMPGQVESYHVANFDWLEDHLRDPQVRVIELSDLTSPVTYYEAHIPGAVYWRWQHALWHPTDRDFATPEQFARLMEYSGVTHETTVVLYSHSKQFASYAFWVCMMRGHNRAKILDGNRNLWVKEKRLMEKELPRVDRIEYPVRPVDHSSRIGRDELLAGLNNPDRIILDLRSPEEYRGERVAPPHFSFDFGAIRYGHIPGAQHLFYRELLDEEERFLPIEKLQAPYEKRGATPDKDIVTYCRLSHRGSMGWFIARFMLGYPQVRVYDGSWTEWGSVVGLPIDNPSLKPSFPQAGDPTPSDNMQ